MEFEKEQKAKVLWKNNDNLSKRIYQLKFVICNEEKKSTNLWTSKKSELTE
jgi:hypothetical protein